ncbi:beta-ketoacyl synthase domain-containing protein [Colletotrichum sp. SAR11_240]|nr:beta-ketoacyl synthase domain-containing protein [Colletotrichum sp. SAR11_240]
MQFSMQQRPILKALAHGEVLHAYAKRSVGEFMNPKHSADVRRGVATAFKVLVVRSSRLLSELAERCGWQGLLLSAAGIQFNAVVGHSSGEIARAFAAGFISVAQAIRIAYFDDVVSAEHASSTSGQPGAMLAAGMSCDDAKELCEMEAFEGRVCVAASNSPDRVIISGDAGAIQHVQSVLEDESTFARLLKVDKAYHLHHTPGLFVGIEVGCHPALKGSRLAAVKDALDGKELPYTGKLSSTTSTFQWKNFVRPRDLEWLDGHALQGQIVFPAAGYIVMAMEAAMRVANDDNYEVELLEIVDMDISKAVVFEDDNRLVDLNLSASVTGEPGQDGMITLKFFIDLCLSKESELLTSAKGEIIIAVADKSSLPAADDESVLLAPEEEHPQINRVNIDSFYKEIDLMGYDYSKDFRFLKTMRRADAKATGTLAFLKL